MTVRCARVGPPVTGCSCPFCTGMRTLSESEGVGPPEPATLVATTRYSDQTSDSLSVGARNEA